MVGNQCQVRRSNSDHAHSRPVIPHHNTTLGAAILMLFIFTQQYSLPKSGKLKINKISFFTMPNVHVCEIKQYLCTVYRFVIVLLYQNQVENLKVKRKRKKKEIINYFSPHCPTTACLPKDTKQSLPTLLKLLQSGVIGVEVKHGEVWSRIG